MVDDADHDSISKLLSTVAIELSNTIRKIKPKLRDLENIETSKKVGVIKCVSWSG